MNSVSLALNNLSRPHRAILWSFTVLTLVIVIWQHYIDYYNPVSTGVGIFNFEKNKTCSSLPVASEFVDQSIQEDEITFKEKLNNKVSNDTNLYEYIVSTGDTLISILNQYGIDLEDITQLIMMDRELHNIKVGQQLSWSLTVTGNLQHLTWKISHYETRIYDRVGNSFKMSHKLNQGNWVRHVMKGTINNNVYDIGLTNSEISALIKVMRWQIDLRKLKKGDQLSVLISRKILNKQNKHSQLIGVHLRSEGKDYYAIRAEDGKFYDRNGICLTKGFLRLPTTKQFRISSNFNLRRLNPVTGRVMPHRGVDFAMPQGTPVLAVGDGEVIAAKHNDTAGFYVAVRHGNIYTTRYMHLYKILVKPGQKVKRGDLIALSGNTGRSTGPHLHYEVWINQEAVNPLTARLPHTTGLTGKDRYNYLVQVKKIIPQLQFN